MVDVTDRAANILHEVQKDAEEPGRVPRLVRGDEGFALAFDQERADDQVVRSGQTPVLLVGSEVAEDVSGATIDCEETNTGIRFTISREEVNEPAP